jgi:hypothetical protein
VSELLEAPELKLQIQAFRAEPLAGDEVEDRKVY